MTVQNVSISGLLPTLEITRSLILSGIEWSLRNEIGSFWSHMASHMRLGAFGQIRTWHKRIVCNETSLFAFHTHPSHHVTHRVTWWRGFTIFFVTSCPIVSFASIMLCFLQRCKMTPKWRHSKRYKKPKLLSALPVRTHSFSSIPGVGTGILLKQWVSFSLLHS